MAQPRSILVVEDDPELRDAVESLLLHKGYRVVSTGDGLHAVELASQHKVDVALVDLLIPGQSGFQVAMDLKAQHGDTVRVVMMTGTASPALRNYAFAAGAERFLPKPFTTTQLLEVVAALCPPPTDQPPSGTHRTVHVGS